MSGRVESVACSGQSRGWPASGIATEPHASCIIVISSMQCGASNKPALHRHRPAKVERLNAPVGQDEASHAEDRRKPPNRGQRPIRTDGRQPAFELFARDIEALLL